MFHKHVECYDGNRTLKNTVQVPFTFGLLLREGAGYDTGKKGIISSIPATWFSERNPLCYS